MPSPTSSSGWTARTCAASRSGSAAGPCPGKELHEAAEQLTANQAGLIAGRRADHRKSSRPGAHQGRQSREAHRGGHDRRNHQRAAANAQELTLPKQSKAALSGAAFLVEVAQYRRLKTVDTAGFPDDEGEFRSGRVPAGRVHLSPAALRSGWVAWEGQAR